MRVLGLMSGTSLDGIDAAIIETDGVTISGFGPAATFPYSPAERAALVEAIADALLGPPESAWPASFAAAEAAILDSHARAARALLAMADAGAVDLLGFHGQTVLHRPEHHLSIQLGNGAALARSTGIDVVASMRQADLAAGGQGAPLVPVYHAALADRIGAARPVAFLNIGGVANLSWIGRDGRIIAFDTGPGNGLIDQLMEERGLGTFDADGRLARSGRVDDDAFACLLVNDFLQRRGPKSLDRYDFTLDAVRALDAADAAATLTAFTAACVALSAAHLPEAPRQWIICGGGRHNPALMDALRLELGTCISADELGLRGDAIEAEAIAFLAARSAAGLALTFPETTGVPHAMTGGQRFAASPGGALQTASGMTKR
ncbi:anhydro-N-acetylmuramic acid kinase [Sphingomonas oleivorans]|uniref:Anhydro-N-acetylmuramic acid kinase n=1 Tax=Sphingomonas oleivorans TaxID=1735121 RepID=A0A2T5FUL5_9SPHN|nr:anhydro-N-acetylmuramic acid kinase [Sphingomonas oleivorans]PTQ08225.1 anhydro-N-acetylmuramic acid kinase [Sphingomonas oleivorans]